MYAVIKTGGKQQKVQAGDVIEVEFMKTDPGTAIEFDPILVVDDDGKPHVRKALADARVVGVPLGDKKAEKIKVFKYRPKSGYKRTQGHRQLMTVIEIEEIVLGDRVARKPEPAAEKPAEDAGDEAPKAAKKSSKKAPAKKSGSKKTATKKKSASKKSGAKKASSKG